MLSKRFSTMLLSGAALAGLGTSFANAGLLIDVRAFTKNGEAVSNPKYVDLVHVGDTIIFRVFAQVTGSNNNLPDCIQSMSGSFLTQFGGSFGNLSLVASGITAPFNATGSSPGQATDLDGDGDLDIGSNNPGDPAGFFAIRSLLLSGPRSTSANGASVYPADAAPTSIANGSEYRIVSNLRLVVGNSGFFTEVNFRTRASNTGGFWAQDATEVVTDNGDGTTAYSYTGGQAFSDTSDVLSGPPVLVTFDPEPTSLGLAAVAGLGMLVRRRR